MKVSLGPLPASTDEYWKEANINKHELQAPVLCEHHFVRMTGTEVHCNKCHVGFIVTPDIELREGHLMKHGSQMI